MIEYASAGAVPHRHRHTLHRPRLLQAMQRPAALFVVRGPAGNGKTTLLAEWLRSREAESTVLWLNFNGADRSAHDVWLAVIRVLEENGAVPAGAAELAADAIATAQADDVAVAHTLRDLVRSGSQASDRPIAVAIDHGNALTASAVEEIVEVLAVTPALTIGVATRGRGEFHSTAVRMAVDTVILEDSELEFTREETAAVLAAAGLPNGVATVQLVRDAAGGHARATRAALAALASASASRHPKLPELRQIVLESLHWNKAKQRALLADDRLFLEFLVRSSVLTEVPIGYAETLVAALAEQPAAEPGAEPGAEPARRADAGALLDRAERLGFGSPIGFGGERRFRFLTVARNAFSATLDSRPANESGAVRAHAAQWLATHGDLEEGFLLALAARDYDTAEYAAARRFTTLLRFQPDTVRIALAQVPMLTLGRYPLLAMMLGLAYNLVPRLRMRAIEYFGVAIMGAKRARPGMGATELVVLDTVMGGALRITGQAERAGRAAKRALAALSTLSESELGELGTIVDAVTVQSGISLLYSGEPESALEAFRRSSAPEDSPHSLHALAALAGTHALLGEMRESTELVAEGTAREWPDGWIDGYQGALFQIARAWLALESFDLDTAQEAVDSIDEHIATIEHWPLFAEAQAQIDLFAGRPDVGSERLHSARRRKRGRIDLDRGSRQRLDIAASTLHLSAGRLRQAESVLGNISVPDAGALVARARVQLVRDAPDAARALLLEAAALPASERCRAEQLALECAAMVRLGQHDAAALGLERLVGLLEFAELLTPLALLPGEDLQALRALADQRCSAETIRLLGQKIPTVLRTHSIVVLSERERVVLRALVTTGSVSEIAESLFVSVNTVKSQLRSLYRKLGASSRDDALAIAASQRLLASAGASGSDATTDAAPSFGAGEVRT